MRKRRAHYASKSDPLKGGKVFTTAVFDQMAQNNPGLSDTYQIVSAPSGVFQGRIREVGLISSEHRNGARSRRQEGDLRRSVTHD